MQFFKSTLVLTLAMATYVTASALLQPRQATCGERCGAIPDIECDTGCTCSNLLEGTVSDILSQNQLEKLAMLTQSAINSAPRALTVEQSCE